MRTERFALAVLLAVGAAVPAVAVAEEYRGTMQEQMACTPDVWRLCSDQVPDVGRITACLRQNTPQLSSGCRAVFESNNQMQAQQPVTRNRPAPPQQRYNPAPPPQPQPYDDD